MVDMERIDELAQEIGKDDLLIVLDMFLIEARKTIATIGAGLSDEEHAKATHFLRSGALNIGLISFAAQADRVAASPAPDRASMASTLTTSLQASVDAIDLQVSSA